MQFKEKKNEVVEKAKPKGTASRTSKQGKVFGHDVRSIPEAKEETPPGNIGTRKRRQKSSPYKVRVDETVFFLVFIFCRSILCFHWLFFGKNFVV